MKRRPKDDSLRSRSEPGDADVFDAKEALASGDAQPVGHHLRDLGEVLNLLADLFNSADTEKGPPWQIQLVPRGRQRVRVKGKAARAPDDSEWEGSLVQIRQAIANGSAEAIGSYLRDAADFLSRLAPALNPAPGSRNWRLKFVREGRGRRSDRTREMLKATSLVTELKFATRDAGKQEAALAEVKAKRGISRATIMRAKSRNKGRQKSLKKR